MNTSSDNTTRQNHEPPCIMHTQHHEYTTSTPQVHHKYTTGTPQVHHRSIPTFPAIHLFDTFGIRLSLRDSMSLCEMNTFCENLSFSRSHKTLYNSCSLRCTATTPQQHNHSSSTHVHDRTYRSSNNTSSNNNKLVPTTTPTSPRTQTRLDRPK